jgi:hypothetical protein
MKVIIDRVVLIFTMFVNVFTHCRVFWLLFPPLSALILIEYFTEFHSTSPFRSLIVVFKNLVETLKHTLYFPDSTF